MDQAKIYSFNFFMQPERQCFPNGWQICPCSGDEVKNLLQNLEKTKQEAPYEGFNDIIDNKPYKELNQSAKSLVDFCMAYLYFCRFNKKQDYLNDFIKNTLEISSEKGYNELLLNYLSNHDFIEEGISIRCPVLKDFFLD